MEIRKREGKVECSTWIYLIPWEGGVLTTAGGLLQNRVGRGGLDLEEIWNSPTYFSGLLASGAGLAGRSLGNTYSSWELGWVIKGGRNEGGRAMRCASEFETVFYVARLVSDLLGLCIVRRS